MEYDDYNNTFVTEYEGELKKFNKPYKIFGHESIEIWAYEQFFSAMACDFSIQGALMTDAHPGYAMPIGGVIATKDHIVPAWVGYDIGCGVCAVKTTYLLEEVKTAARKIFEKIYQLIPVGFHHHKVEQLWKIDWTKNFTDPTEWMLETYWSKEKPGARQLGTLGSGNHFIEIGHDHEDKVWIIVHSGSRNIGHTCAKRYMKLASPDNKAREDHFGFDTHSPNGKDYIRDLDFCLQFALANRRSIIDRTLEAIGTCVPDGTETEPIETLINRNHNHAEFNKNLGLWIHRKGATHAEKDMLGVIPGNMRDGSYIVRGKGNPDSLFSSSHGAGRTMSRKKAREIARIDEFEKQMENITAQVGTGTLDESPIAYKNIHAIMEHQVNLVDIVTHVQPIINIKG
jgi:tRNA-splicing ligase RtcB